MTLKEVAARAGVSVSTVSRIINSPDDSFARKEVRERVWAIIKETGYTPNLNARELKQGKSKARNTSEGALACILGRTRTLDDNPFFAQLSRVVEQQAMERKYPVRLSYSVFDVKDASALEKIEAIHVDGAVVLGRFNEYSMDFLQQHYKNIVYVGRNHVNAPWDQVICDGYEATQIAMEHLISYGHQRIAYIGETLNEIRYQAYRDSIRRHSLDSSRRLVCETSHSSEGGYRGADLLLKLGIPLPTAVFCAADVSAIAALRRFTEARIKVPDQISVVSMDNIEMSGYVSPMLTTVGMPIMEMGNMAVQTLIGRIQKQHKLPLKIDLPNRLILRESVSNLNAGMYI
ncbi:LacI family DNA-binding transcriptional regulator [Muricomes intestini]|jgi:LacI family transcriptional regulator|uniref:LacI family DNA-binding transcriptional regulator n=3 Tax=Muricomes intestini TaxID=1796634 RepID=UPI000E957674|nr:LacI family transcriptional regulator [Lachnospiraceae bacterium]